MVTATEPMVNNQVQKTTDYSIFKQIEGNRTKNPIHLKRLKEAMEKKYLFTVIIVNENHEIIDGQHRFECCKELGLPVYYIICKGYGLNEVHIFNQNSKDWNHSDYVAGYCDIGLKDYEVYRDFQKKYKFGHKQNIELLSGQKYCSAEMQKFKLGQFKVTQLKKAYTMAEDIKKIAPYYAGYKRREFIATMIDLLNNPKFSIKRFVRKLKIQPTALKDCVSVDQYKLHIENIYNYRESDKVGLRY